MNAIPTRNKKDYSFTHLYKVFFFYIFEQETGTMFEKLA